MSGKAGTRPISNQGRFDRPVTIDERDLHWFTSHNWSDNGNGYLRAYDPATGKNVYLHRVMMGAKQGQFVDHANGDTYDMRRSNLRFTTHNRNLNSARKKIVRTDTDHPVSTFVGVGWHSKRGKWMASFRRRYLGLFADDAEAGRAYDAERIRLGFEPINFKG